MQRAIATLVLFLCSYLFGQPAQSQVTNKLVRIVYFSPSEGPAQLDSERVLRLKTLLEVTQKYYLDEMTRLGYGSVTFQFEKDTDSRPVVYYLRGQHPASYYGTDKTGLDAGYDSFGIYGKIAPEIQAAFDPQGDKVLGVVCKNCPWLGGGRFGVVGDYLLSDHGSTYQDQMQVFCDKSIPREPETQGSGFYNSTRGVLSSARVGGFMHELGHSLGAPHSNDWSLMGSGGHYAIAKHFVPNCYNNETPPPIGLETGPIIAQSGYMMAMAPGPSPSPSPAPPIEIRVKIPSAAVVRGVAADPTDLSKTINVRLSLKRPGQANFSQYGTESASRLATSLYADKTDPLYRTKHAFYFSIRPRMKPGTVLRFETQSPSGQWVNALETNY